jgi:hypothetical protein
MVELRGFEPLTPSMRMWLSHSNDFERTSAFPVKSQLVPRQAMFARVTTWRSRSS